MRTLTLSSLACLFTSFFLLSGALLPSAMGQKDRCATDEMHQKLMNASPQAAQRIKTAQQEVRDQWDQPEQRAGQVYTIPVVFHVVHDNGPEKISPQLVQEAIARLNLDYRKNNADTSDIVATFKPIASDVEVEFRLAQKDPDGNCHRGITYTKSDLTYNAYNNGIKDLIQWDPSSYLNIWVCNSIGGNVAGYSLKPAGAEFNPGEDGIVVAYSFVGYNERTLTHEAGHYLSLDHPWGGGDPGVSCGDDGINDTPETKGWQTCDLNGTTCDGNLDNVQNYMSYSFCSRMFTTDQGSAMRSALNSSIADRNQLWTSSNLQETGVSGNDILCEVDFKATNRIVCVGDTLQFTDLSFHGPTSWDWEFFGGNAPTTTVQDPTVSYPDTGTYDVALTVQNSSGTLSDTLEDYIRVVPSPGFPFPWVHDFDYMGSLDGHREFFVDNPGGDNIAWVYTQQAGEGPSDGCIKLNNYNNNAGKVDVVKTTSMDASAVAPGNLEVSFDVAYCKKNSGDQGELRLYASNTCGKSWSLRGTFSSDDIQTTSGPISSQAFVPLDDQWTRKTVNASLTSSYNVEDLRIKFEFTSGGGNNLYIDNINVHDEQNVSIEKEKQEGPAWSLHPNPVQKQAFLELNLSERKEVSVEVLDIRGKKLLDVKNGKDLRAGKHRIQLDLQGIEAGPYFVRLRTGDQQHTRKLFKR
ncbi:MAG: M43 family zinc metalloprotease [Flavobacteriales bacterium]